MFDDIMDAKDKLNNAIINCISDVIKKAALEAKNKSLDPIQTYILIQDKVQDKMSEIEIVLEPYSITLTDLGQLDQKITKLMKPYDKAKELEIEKQVDKILNSHTLFELFERSEYLSKLCYELKDFSTRGYVIKRKRKTLK